MSLIVFSHGNGFPGGTYRRLTQALEDLGHQVSVVDRFGHNPDLPVTDNWPNLVLELTQHVRAATEAAGEPAWLVGHSLGGMLSAMVAAQTAPRPELIGRHGILGVVLLDSPMVGSWQAKVVAASKRTALVGRLSPGAVSSKRRQHWPDRAAARQHFAQKPVFARWAPEVLEDYLEAGLEDRPDGCWLRFDREVETQIYNGLPHHLEAFFRRHPLRVPMSFVGGLQSTELRQAGLSLTQRLTKGRIHRLNGSHLFPMERPLVAAQAVQTALMAMTEDLRLTP